jgi:Na+/proline symporter
MVTTCSWPAHKGHTWRWKSVWSQPGPRSKVRKTLALSRPDPSPRPHHATVAELGTTQAKDMPSFFGLKPIDITMIVVYFLAVMSIGLWASRRVKNQQDFFLGGRRFGKGLLVMHWLCTGTHSEQAVQVAGATARVGLGGIWYQWMYLFSTPFYWMIAPIIRRLRVTTTGDFFRIRYGRGLEMLYSVVALTYFVLSIAMLLRGAGAAIAGATGGALPTHHSVILLSILCSTYVMAGGLVAAAYTDVFQGVMIIVLSLLLVPAGLNLIGGWEGLAQKLNPAMLSITAPPGAREGDLGFVIAMSLLGLVGVVVQPHVMSATGSGKTEMEARVGMCYGNFIKRFLTIAWAFTGIIAIVHFPEVLHTLDLSSEEARRASETLFGRSIQHFLGDGWRGLMIACLIAGVTSTETFMVVGSGIFTLNFYKHVVPNGDEGHYLWIGRIAAVGLLGTGILLAFYAESLTQIVVASFQVVGLLGAAFWLGVTWRRANAAGVWASFCGALLAWLASGINPESVGRIPWVTGVLQAYLASSQAFQILVMLAVEFSLLILVSLLTRPHPDSQLNPFFARLHTPVGMERELAAPSIAGAVAQADPEDEIILDYHKASTYAYPRLQRLGIEIPRMTWTDGGGFLLAWGLVAALIGLLKALASSGR